jgi:hypothetical protein
MQMKTLPAAILVLGLLVPGGASAYTPRHGMPCRHGYSKVFKVVKRHGQRRRVRTCVKHKARFPTTATKLHAHLDPTYTRDPLDPFTVTYAYRASATQEVAATASASPATASGTEEPAPLPWGVLALYSDGRLECAINVGGSTTGSDCPVSYQVLGSHTVTTIYSSGEESATETETEVIAPLPTVTTLSLRYSDREGGPVITTEDRQCTYGWGPEHDEEVCDFTYEWMLGAVAIEGSSSPAGAVKLRCTADTSWCPTSVSGKTLNGALSAPVALRVKATQRGKVVTANPPCEWLKERASDWSYPLELGLEATPLASGYTPSVAADSAQIAPTLPC